MSVEFRNQIQGDLNKLYFASSTDQFTAAKQTAVTNIDQMLVLADPETTDQLLAWKAVVSGLTYTGDVLPEQIPLDSERVERVIANQDFMPNDMIFLMEVLRELSKTNRQFAQGLEIENLQKQVELAKQTRQMAGSANADNWAKEISQAIGELVGAAVSGAFGAASLGIAAKASKLRGETDEIRDTVRQQESALADANGLARKSAADLVTAKQLAADARLDLKTTLRETKLDLSKAKKAKEEAALNGDTAAEALADSKIKEIKDLRALKKSNRDQAEKRVEWLTKEDVRLQAQVDTVKQSIQKEQDKMSDIETEVDNLLNLARSSNTLGTAANGMFRAGFNIGAAQYGFNAAETNADIQYNQTMMEVAGKFAQTFSEYRSNFKNSADEVAAAEKSMMESQNEFGKHVSTYS